MDAAQFAAHDRFDATEIDRLFDPQRARAWQAAREQFMMRDRVDEPARLVQFVRPGFAAGAPRRQHAGQAQPVRRRVGQALVRARDRVVEQALGDLVDCLDARFERFAVAQAALIDGVEPQVQRCSSAVAWPDP